MSAQLGIKRASVVGAARPPTNEELNDLISQTFITKVYINDVREFMKLTSTAGHEAIPIANFKKLIQLAIKQIENNVCSMHSALFALVRACIFLILYSIVCIMNVQTLPADTRDKILNDAPVLNYFTLIYAVLASAVRVLVKDSTFQSDLQKLNIKAEYVAELVNEYKTKKEQIMTSIKEQRIALPTITSQSSPFPALFLSLPLPSSYLFLLPLCCCCLIRCAMASRCCNQHDIIVTCVQASYYLSDYQQSSSHHHHSPRSSLLSLVWLNWIVSALLNLRMLWMNLGVGEGEISNFECRLEQRLFVFIEVD